jgi:N-acetylmuramoyl-L-alanine amidase
MDKPEKLRIILDPAHGSDVAGKCSPDGTHHEWKWSREICNQLGLSLIQEGFKVDFTNYGELEIGILNRQKIADKIPGTRNLLVSMHNNAAGMGDKWMKARGVCIWTSPGHTKSDPSAEIVMNELESAFPEISFRKDMIDGDQDYEAKFTVLMGKNYRGFLLEWNFQDNHEDLAIIKDAAYNQKLINTMVKAIIRIDKEVI